MKNQMTAGTARHIADRRILLRNPGHSADTDSTTWQVRVLESDYYTLRTIAFEGALADAIECCDNMREGFAHAIAAA